ncbi:TIGR02996 domain-containing protein [Gemmata sp. JC673]|uniref:TIGR02996 domain-containing protein n=1 Tax=Gemmata algarum TaxID=2975278 RepID=A0ABU5ETJ7_9BACT|nr:TIGR02996 domain-containing protein [Gemmata algarum]MDY3558293.1 TIGR02996 domain-containing protein [Gemmata algarum]
MDADERALLDAIIAEPDEDTPRLVYADWLDEHGGHERAELIRAQIGLLRSKDDGAAIQQRNAWQACVRVLLRAHSERWRKELPKVPRARWGPFERGMVESVTLAINSWYSDADQVFMSLFGHAPLRTLRADFSGFSPPTPGTCAGLLGWKGLRRFAELRLAVQFHPFNLRSGEDPISVFLAPLWTHAWADRPQVIDLRECDLRDDAVQPLMAGPLHRLPALVFAQRSFGESVRAVLTARLKHGVRFV